MGTTVQDLSELDTERLAELAHVGAGYAARALSQVLNRLVLAHLPVVRGAGDPFDGERSTAILFEAQGDLAGTVALLMPDASRVTVLGMLLRGQAEGAPAETVESALQELGNIVASQTVSAIADRLGSRILLSVPALVVTADAALAARLAERGAGVRIESELADREGKVRSLLVLVPEIKKAQG